MSVETKALFNQSVDQLLLLVDEGHQDFLHIAESFQETVVSHRASYTKIAQLFLQTCTVIRMHYADEEALMENMHFSIRQPSKYQEHVGQHKNVLHTLDEFSNRFLLATHDTYLSLAQEIADFFRTLQLHIDIHDKELLSMCLAE